eukprot:gene15138-biopygen11197
MSSGSSLTFQRLLGAGWRGKNLAMLQVRPARECRRGTDALLTFGVPLISQTWMMWKMNEWSRSGQGLRTYA